MADLITLLSSAVLDSESDSNGDGGDSCADPLGPLQEFKKGFRGC
jgi:hypothetical protein